MELGIYLAESGWLPDGVLRASIRHLIRQRLRSARLNMENGHEQAFVNSLASSLIAPASDASKTQHYEAPTEFFQLVLGPYLKYSCCLFENETMTLAAAEEAMLALTCERAELQDGMAILELGCGWGSLTLWMAEKYPTSTIVAVSNSATQRAYIEQTSQELGFNNVSVITADMNEFSISKRFDRVVSVEMFEHMRNYPKLLRRISEWLTPEGKLFVHIFCHARHTYPFLAEGATNWMARNFFTGGMMPSFDLLSRFDSHLKVETRWKINGMHYYRTCTAWLDQLDAHRKAAEEVFRTYYPTINAARQVQRWRMFFMACAELFGYDKGEEWFVGHYRLCPSHPIP